MKNQNKKPSSNKHLEKKSPSKNELINEDEIQDSSELIKSNFSLEVREKFEGPIPHPNILKQYESIIEGSANRLLLQFEAQSIHRRTLEKDVIKSQISNSKIGLILGFIITIICVFAGTFLIYNDKDGIGFGTIILAIGSLITAYVYGKKAQAKELKEKRDENRKILEILNKEKQSENE